MIGSWLTYFFYIACSGFINRTRGMDIISRTTFTIFNGLMSYVLFKDWILAVICSIGILLWLMRTWGKYFIAYKPRMDEYRNRRGVEFIDKFVDKFYKIPTNKEELMKWGMFAMGLRGSIFSIPLFVALAVYYKTWWISLFFIVMLLQGLYYYQGFFKYNFKYTEMMTGYTYSSLIVAAMLIGG